MKCKVKLVDITLGAQYLDRVMTFDPADLAWTQEHTNRQAMTGKVYPDVTEFCFKGSDVVFRARTKDFFEATK